MKIKHVERAKEKHRYLMYLIRKVAKRTEGMGLKISKYHMITHMADDILNFGVPMEYDTGTNESGHKSEGKAASLTQKCKETFDIQTAIRLLEKFLLELAEQEMEGKVMWNYFIKTNQQVAKAPENDAKIITGATITAKQNAITHLYYAIITTGSQEKEIPLENDLMEYLHDLQNAVKDYIPDLAMRTEYKRLGYIFRAHSKFKGRVWRDWVNVSWQEDEDDSPVHLMGFVDLTALPKEGLHNTAEFEELYPGVCAIAETSTYCTDKAECNLSEMWRPLYKDIGSFTHNRVSHRKFLLVDVEAFVKPTAVVPDFGGPPNRYFELKDHAKWGEDFEKWLQTRHKDEDFSDSDDDSDEEFRPNWDEFSDDDDDTVDEIDENCANDDANSDSDDESSDED